MKKQLLDLRLVLGLLAQEFVLQKQNSPCLFQLMLSAFYSYHGVDLNLLDCCAVRIA